MQRVNVYDGCLYIIGNIIIIILYFKLPGLVCQLRPPMNIFLEQK